jgi:zinc transport system substrate-binding protein
MWRMIVVVRGRRLSGVAVVVMAAALAVTGCGIGSSAQFPHDGRVHVVASFYPFEYVAARVGGDRVDVVNLTKPGAEPHDLELTPHQVGAVAEAALVVYEEGFQPAVDDAVSQNNAAHALEVTSVVPLTNHDPHIWLDPVRLGTVADAVATRLSSVDPSGAATYRANAAALRADLAGVDAEFRAGLASCRITAFVTSHEAFGYLAQRYGLEQIAISGLSPEAEPSPSRLAEIATIAKDKHLTTIFYEKLVSPKTSQTIADELGLRTQVLDPLEGVTGGDTYLSVMRRNLAALQEANSCT